MVSSDYIQFSLYYLSLNLNVVGIIPIFLRGIPEAVMRMVTELCSLRDEIEEFEVEVF